MSGRRLTATMVVDLKDRTGQSTRAIIGNMDRLKRAERDLSLANAGVTLGRRDRAMERLLIEQDAEMERRRALYRKWAGVAAAGAVVAGTVAAKAYTDFAELERRVNRIVINADKGADAIRPTITKLQAIASATKMSFEDVVSGLETLVASGRSLDESLAFLPSVTLTAQASGAAISDIALSADALAGSMKIAGGDMQKAFDILVAGGKAGKFELKDMAQYLPSLLPAFSALGYEGTEGLQKIVAMLQVVRNQAGASSDAATYLSNVFQKMYSDATAKKFHDFGIDITEALDKAKREGRDVVDVFLDMTMIATKGDLSKLTKLFTDAEMQKGVRALIMQRDVLRQLTTELGHVDGSAFKDFNQIVTDSQAGLQELSNLWDKFMTQVGSGVATVVNPALRSTTSAIEDAVDSARAEKGMTEAQRNKQRNAFGEAYRKAHPDAWFWEVNDAYSQAKAKVGRGEAKTVFEGLTASRGRQNRPVVLPQAGGKGRDIDPYHLPESDVPTPFGRPGPTKTGRGYEAGMTGRGLSCCSGYSSSMRAFPAQVI
ncbi:phage tail tape measure protein [Rhizobium sp. PAMB 3174]